MSKKSKHILGGVVALLFIVSIVNTQAIISLSKKVESALSQKVAYVTDRAQTGNRVMGEYYVGNQTASVLPGIGDEIFYPEPEDPEGGGVYEIFFGNGLCAIVTETTSTPGTTFTSNEDGQLHCNSDNPGLANPGDGQGIIQVNPQTGLVVISGVSTASTAMKLHVLGYGDQSKMAPWPPTNISEMLRAFQRDNGISQTGTVGTLTTRVLDSKVNSLMVWKTEKKYKIYSQDYAVRQQAALGIMGVDVPEPGGGGYIIEVYTPNVLEGTCTLSYTNTDSGASGSTTWEGPCDPPPASGPTNDPILNMINFQTREGRATGNGTLATATKLSLLGYMSGQSKMAPWPPTNLSEIIKTFQKNNGISPTGTAGPLTTAALDARIANLRAELVSTKYYVNDPSEYPEDAEIFYRY